MTINDDGKSCHDCRQLRIERKAHRIMPSGAAVCEEHYRSRMGLPQRTNFVPEIPKKTGEPQMGKKPDQTKIDAIQKDATAGLNMNAISLKHGVTWATARKYSRARGGGNPTKTQKHKKFNRNGHVQTNGAITIHATPEMLDAIWNSLSLQKKAELLTRPA